MKVGSFVLSLYLMFLSTLCYSKIDRSKDSLKVAFIGDSGNEEPFSEVLRLIKSENVDLVIHLGDLGYDETNPQAPELWGQRVDDVLGKKFPYVFLIGNHDENQWFQKDPIGYETLLKQRLEHNPEIKCFGEEPGIKSYCTFRGLFFVLSGIGTHGKKHEEFIRYALEQSKDYAWRVCGWHKNQNDMHTGANEDEVGWDAYRICEEFGAFVAQGHEHTYSRTMNLKNVGNRDLHHGAFGDVKNLVLDRGQNFVFVSGVGGDSLRSFECDHQSDKWWATVFSGNYFMQNGMIKFNNCTLGPSLEDVGPGGPNQFNFGALFVTFHHDAKLANAEFKTIEGLVIDTFTIQSKL